MASPGTGQRRVNDLLIEVSLHLLQPIVWTALTAPISSGVQSAPVGSISNMFEGASIVVGFGTANVEAVTISGIGEGTFTATFLNSHASGETVTGATFPAQESTDPIFTASEIISYIARAQNEFLAQVACIFATFDQTVSIGELYQPTPPTAIEINHISCQGVRLYELTQTELTMRDRNWRVESILTPTAFFEDRTGLYQWGVNGIPRSNFPVEILASIRDADTLGLLDGFLVPDFILHGPKYRVLQYCLSKDGVMCDPLRARYCGERADRVALGAARWLDVIGSMAGMKR